jgi:hypothetical protein
VRTNGWFDPNIEVVGAMSLAVSVWMFVAAGPLLDLKGRSPVSESSRRAGLALHVGGQLIAILFIAEAVRVFVQLMLVGASTRVVEDLVTILCLLMLSLVLVAPGYATLCDCLRQLALRLGDEPLARSIGRQMWLVAAMNILGSGLLGLGHILAVLMMTMLLQRVRLRVLAGRGSSGRSGRSMRRGASR